MALPRAGVTILCLLALLAGSDAAAQLDPGAISPAQVDRALEEAADAIRAGDVDRAEHAYRAVLRARPGHDLAYRQLWIIDRARGIADDPEQRDRLAKQFPSGWRLRQSRHYLVLHDAPDRWAEARQTLLEKTYDAFITQFKGKGLKPYPLERRLECVLFAEHEDFLGYARSVDRLDAEWPAGYYSSRTNRIAMFNFATSPQMDELAEEMDQLRKRVDRLAGARPGDGRGASELTTAQRELNRVQRRYETIGAWGNIQQTIHEAVHQLAFNTGIQRRDVQYPFWFSEGLATCFETTHPGAPFGPMHDNRQRRFHLKRAFTRGQLYPLQQFLRLASPPDGDHPRKVAYAQAWGMFRYLYNSRPNQLRDYIHHMLTRPAGRRDPDTLVDDFVKAFGPVDPIEQDWLRFARASSR